MSQVVSNTIKISLFIYGGTLLGAVLIILLPWALGSEEKVGFYRFLNSTAYLVNFVCGLGMFQTIQKYFPQYESRSQNHSGFLGFTWSITLIAFLLFSFLVLLFKGNILSSLLKNGQSSLISVHYNLILLLSFGYLFYSLIQNTAQAFFKPGIPIFSKEVVIRILVLMLAIFCGLKIISFSQFLVGFVFANLVVFAINHLWLINQEQWSFSLNGNIKKLEISSLLKFSSFNFLNQANTYLVENIDAFLITFLAVKGMADTGVFSIYLFMGQVIAIPQRAMLATFSPRIAKAFYQQDTFTINRIYKKSALLQLIISGLMYLLLVVNIKSIITFFSQFGEGYAAGGSVALIIGFGKLVDCATGLNTAILNFSAYYRWNFMVNFILLLILIIADVLLIPSYGLLGAAVATALAYIFYNIIKLGVIYYYFKVQPFDSNTIKALLVLLGGILLSTFLPVMGSIYSDMIVRSFIVSVYYALAVYLLKLSPDINHLVDKLLHKWRLLIRR